MKPWKQKLLYNKHRNFLLFPKRRLNWVIRPAPKWCRDYTRKVCYPNYASLIRVANTQRKPKRTK